MFRNTKRTRVNLFLGAGLATLAASSAAFAQDATSSAEQSAGLDDIVVTAQRREENLQDVPIAVAAVTAETLQSSGINDTSQLQEVVPGLVLTNVAGNTQVRVRGIGTNVFGAGIENAVATYVDGVYLASTTGMMFDLANIERVEVLKGPQGTLFGRNATGGLIQIITADPPEEFEGLARLTLGNYETTGVDAYIGGPLANNLGADLTVHYASQGEGYGTNLFTGNDTNQADDNLIVRSKIVFDPSSTLGFELALDYGITEGHSAAIIAAAPGAGNAGLFQGFYGPAALGGFYDINQNIDSEDETESYGASLTSRLALSDNLELESITAYRVTKFGLSTDLDALPYDALNFEIQLDSEQFTQEFKLSGDVGALDYTAGVYYFRSSSKNDPQNLIFRPQGFFLLEAPFGPFPAGTTTGLDEIQNAIYTEATAESVALYAQGTYALTDQTSVTLGVRYTEEEKEIDGTQEMIGYVGGVATLPFVPTGTPFNPPGFESQRSWDNLSYRVAIDHDFTDDIMAYASVSTGFRSGGYNAGVSGNPSYDPEELTAYEVGLKTELFDNRVRFNVAAFYNDYQNIHTSTFVAGNIFIVNGDEATSQGFDAEFEAVLSDALTLNGGVSVVDAEFASGNALPNSPEFTANFGFNYETDFAGGLLGFGGNVFHSDGWLGSIDNDPRLRQDAYDIVSASLYYELAEDGPRVTLFGRNLLDEEHMRSNSVAFGQVSYSPAEPLTWGVSIETRF